MLHSKRSKNTQWKIALIIPVLIAFLATFNTKVIAQTGKKEVKHIQKEKDIFALTINKKTTDAELDDLVKTFDKKGLKLKFSNVKRNKEGLISSIKIDAELKNNKASAAYACEESDGINSIVISVDEKNNSINIGSSHNDILYKFKGKANNDNALLLKRSKDHDYTYVWVNKDGDTTKVTSKKIIVEMDDEEAEEAEELEESEEIIIIDEDDDNSTSEEKEVKVIVRKKEGRDLYLMTEKGMDPIYFIDGKKSTKEEVDKLLPDSILSMNVLKGEAATLKYGSAAKNGVIVITTKK